MRVDELRPLAIFEGLSDERLERAAVRRPHEVEIEPGVRAVHRG